MNGRGQRAHNQDQLTKIEEDIQHKTYNFNYL